MHALAHFSLLVVWWMVRSTNAFTVSKTGCCTRTSVLVPAAAADPSEIELTPEVVEAEELTSYDPDRIMPTRGAATGTINERLKRELREIEENNALATRTPIGDKLRKLGFMASTKTDAEREAAIAEARDLNGVNPFVAIASSFVALAIAAALWWVTTHLAAFFTLHPVNEADFYVIQRGQGVFRNVVMGLSSLAAGFFGVTGLGILFLGIRVGYGVITGELDPTPVRKSSKDDVQLPNIVDLMLNKRPNRRNGGNDNSPFGI